MIALDTNDVSMVGKLTNISIIWQKNEEAFYKAFLEVERNSNVQDILPITISGNLLSQIDVNSLVEIKGQLRSKDTLTKDDKLKVDLYIQVKEILNKDDDYSTCTNNKVSLSGYLCKKPNLRNTPLGRQIADILLACNYGKDKTAYLPIIAWGRDARKASKLNVGDHIQMEGRFQCRPYTKIIDDIPYDRIAYEVSLTYLN